MITIWARRDVDELRLLYHVDVVPFALRDDARIARAQLEAGISRGLSGDLNAPGNHVEYFVAIGMNLAAVRRILRDCDDSHCHAIDPVWWARPMRSGGDGEVTVDIEQEMRDINWGDWFHSTVVSVSGVENPTRSLQMALPRQSHRMRNQRIGVLDL